ncbi:MAG TPA: hypothetical protein VIM92_04985 [Rhodanobacteraceae bacterium]|jgi:hypothetical protein
MVAGIDARQIERVLSHLARLQHRRDQEEDALEDLRPAWLGMDTWDVVLEDLEAQHYKKPVRVARLQLVR